MHDDDEGEREQEETFSGLFHFFFMRARDGYCARARVFLKKGVLGERAKIAKLLVKP